ncbi:MAG: response regulator [Planctomycetota bacterium]|jgi:CheY-like chemotaxis protein
MTPSNQSTASILIVDDNIANLQLLTDVLTELGHHVRAATNGDLALNTARNEPPDLILLDIHMPGKSGYDTCRELKQDQQLRDIPVIFISALNDHDDKEPAYRCGAVDIICKPFQACELAMHIRTQLDLVRAQREIRRLHAETNRYLNELGRTPIDPTADEGPPP